MSPSPGVTLSPLMWQFLLYCEGTRFTEKKHRVSMEVALSKGLPVLKYHLLPRTKGFTTAVQCLRGTGEGQPETAVRALGSAGSETGKSCVQSYSRDGRAV